MAGGRRQILHFLLPGDFFGFSARDKHALTVEAALAGTIVARYPRGTSRCSPIPIPGSRGTFAR